MEVIKKEKTIKTLLIKLDSELWRNLKIKAAVDGTSMKGLIVDALNKTYGL